MNYASPPREKAPPSMQEERRSPLSINSLRVNQARKGNFTLSAAAEARHIERAERQAVAAFARLGGQLRITADGGYLVSAARVCRRCSDMRAVQAFIAELQARKVNAS